MLSGGVPIAQTGVASSYALGALDITLNGSAGKVVETIKDDDIVVRVMTFDHMIFKFIEERLT